MLWEDGTVGIPPQERKQGWRGKHTRVKQQILGEAPKTSLLSAQSWEIHEGLVEKHQIFPGY